MNSWTWTRSVVIVGGGGGGGRGFGGDKWWLKKIQLTLKNGLNKKASFLNYNFNPIIKATNFHFKICRKVSREKNHAISL